jgi:uridine kinase
MNRAMIAAGQRVKRADWIALLVDEIVKRKRANKPFLVGIDGRCASGKTMLADELAASIRLKEPRLDILRPSVDGFHHPQKHRYRQGGFSARGYYEDAFDYDAVVECVLGPLSGDRFPAPCRQVAHCWRTDMPQDAPAVLVGPNAVLLFDGVFVFRREINAYWDLRILVDVDAETSIARALQRDHNGIDGPEIIDKKYRLRYEPAWRIYVEEEHPELKAHLIVDNRVIAEPTVSWRSKATTPG